MTLWAEAKLGDVCDLVGGGTPSKSNPTFYEGIIPWATVRDMRSELLSDTQYAISQDAVTESSTNIIKADNIVIATRVGLGKACILQQDTAINQDLKAVIPKDGRLTKPFLFQWLKSVSHVIQAAGTGATVQGVKLPFVKSLVMPLPPIPEQQRIVAVLDQAFADIEKARANAEKNLKNARELFDSYLNQMFSQRGEGWVEISVGDVLTLEYGKPLDKSVRKENGLYPAYGANGVKTRSDEYYCETPSIIVGRKGSAGELTFTEDKYWPLDVTYYVGFNSSNYDLHFLYYMLARLNLPSLSTGVKPGINRNVVYGLRVSVPPLNVQKNVAKKLKNIAHETLHATRA